MPMLLLFVCLFIMNSASCSSTKMKVMKRFARFCGRKRRRRTDREDTISDTKVLQNKAYLVRTIPMIFVVLCYLGIYLLVLCTHFVPLFTFHLGKQNNTSLTSWLFVGIYDRRSFPLVPVSPIIITDFSAVEGSKLCKDEQRGGSLC